MTQRTSARLRSRAVRLLRCATLPAGTLLASCTAAAPDAGPAYTDESAVSSKPSAQPPWLSSARVVASGAGGLFTNCRSALCRHNEDTDLVDHHGATFLVHRTALSQVLGPDSSLHVYRSSDGGQTFSPIAVISAPLVRDIRDPHFYRVGDRLFIKALTRLPVPSTRDTGVHTLSVEMHSDDDGVTWSHPTLIGPDAESFWRIKRHDNILYTAAYADGDTRVTLFSSLDGTNWRRGATIYDKSEHTPSETELTFLPSGKLLALVRTDGSTDQLLGSGALRTKVCWADPPSYTSFRCPQDIEGQRFDGPLTFLSGGRLFIVARKHLPGSDARKRTALFEVLGDLDGGPIDVRELGELPSAGDTAYAGVATRPDGRLLVSWYSGRLASDEGWLTGMLAPTDIWLGVVDPGAL